MRIVQATTAHPADDIRISGKICNSLAEANYDVTLLSPDNSNLDIKGLKKISVMKPSGRGWRILSASFRCIWGLRRHNFEIFHFHDTELLIAGIYYSLLGKKIIFDVHENIFLMFREKDRLPFKSLFQFLLRGFLNGLPGNIDFVLAEESYLPYFQLTQGKKILVRNFPKLNHLSLYREMTRSYQSPRLFYVGNISRVRGILCILQAMEILKKIWPDIRFDCVGDIVDGVDQDPEFCRLMKVLKANVYFHGRLGHHEAFTIARSSNLGLAILMPMLNYLESYPTKVFEYMAIGLPYMYSSFPSYVTLLQGKGGMAIDPLDPSDLAKKIEELFKKPQELERLAAESCKNASSFDWNDEFSRLVGLYEAKRSV